MTDTDGKVTLYAGYTPWGDTLETYGAGDFTYGYLGGLMDTITGLIYLGNGQYYDPQTGRLLNSNTQTTEQTTSNLPWRDPAGAMVAPLAIVSMLYGKKKKRTKWDYVIIAIVLVVSVGMSLPKIGTVSAEPPNSAFPGKTIPPTPYNPYEIQPIPTTEAYTGPYAQPGIPSVITLLDRCYKLPPDSRFDINGSWRNFDPTIHPLNITWSPNSHIPLSKDIYGGQNQTQINENVDHVKKSGNYCGQISLSMIAAKYGYENTFYQIYLKTNETTETTYSYELARAAIKVLSYGKITNWYAKTYSAQTVATYKTSDLLNKKIDTFADETLESYYTNFAGFLRLRLYMGHNFIMLTRLSDTTLTINGGIGVGHWVALNAMSAEWDNENEESSWNWVMVNNPYKNRYEYYPWIYFKNTMLLKSNNFLEIWPDYYGALY